ncbi:MAG: ChbG/HpnK family deacetylase [Planctomycetota bacterium]|nr:ChbG/HpnK family deacetylase [Planctomycetota bacterium]
MLNLIVRADDAGSFRSANRAIRQVCEQGIARNVSLLACGPFIEDAARTLRGLSGICFGLHVCLNAEWEQPRWGPVLGSKAAACLKDEDGTFPRSPLTLHQRGAAVADMMPEIVAQHERLLRLGFEVRYLDEHMGIGWINGLSEALAEYAAKHGLVYRPEVPHLTLAPARPGESLAARLSAALASAEGLRLLITHPTFDDEEMRPVWGANHAPGSVGRQRDEDRRALCAAEVLAACEQRGVRLLTYASLL